MHPSNSNTRRNWKVSIFVYKVCWFSACNRFNVVPLRENLHLKCLVLKDSKWHRFISSYSFNWFCVIWSTLHAYLQFILMWLDNKPEENLTHIMPYILFFLFSTFFYARSNLRYLIIKIWDVSNLVLKLTRVIKVCYQSLYMSDSIYAWYFL